MKYLVKLHHDEEGWAVWVPALPGCASQGDTEAEALENISDAIREYLASLDDMAESADTRFVQVG